MTLRELVKLLNKIKKVHPEAKDAIVFASSTLDNLEFQVCDIRYSKRYSRPRILLEE